MPYNVIMDPIAESGNVISIFEDAFTIYVPADDNEVVVAKVELLKPSNLSFKAVVKPPPFAIGKTPVTLVVKLTAPSAILTVVTAPSLTVAALPVVF